MRHYAVLSVVLAFALSGCVTPDADEGRTDVGCPVSVPGLPDEGDAVEVHVANEMEADTCVRVFFDETLVASSPLSGKEPLLHNNPKSLAEFSWPAGDVKVQVVDTETGRSSEETLTIAEGQKTWVVAWVGEGSTTFRTYENEPRWA